MESEDSNFIFKMKYLNHDGKEIDKTEFGIRKKYDILIYGNAFVEYKNNIFKLVNPKNISIILQK